MMRKEPQRNVATWYSRFGVSQYVALFHLPFSSIVMSFVLIGAFTAQTFLISRVILSLAAVFFALQGAHYLDETRGRHWKTAIPKKNLYFFASLFLAIAVCIGVYLSLTVSTLLLVFLVPLVFFPIAYNLELWGEKFHNPLWFGVSWGALVYLGSYFLQSLTISLFSILMATAIGIQSVYILILYQSTKNEGTRALAWNILKGIVIVWNFIALATIVGRLV